MFKSLLRFLGVFVLTVLLQLSQFLLRDIKDVQAIMTGGAESIPTLKLMAIGITILFGLALIFIDYIRDYKFSLHFFFLTYLGFLSAFAYGDFTQLTAAQSSFFYIGISSIFTLIPILIWGLSNQIFHFRSAALLYPLMLLLAGFTPLIINPNLLSLIKGSSLSELCKSSGLLVMIGYLVFWGLNHLSNEDEKKEYSCNWGYGIAFLCFLIGLAASKDLIEIPYKSVVKTQFPQISSYVTFMKQNALQTGSLKLCGSLIGFVLGLFLCYSGSKLWRWFGAGVTALALVVGGSFFMTLLQAENIQKVFSQLSWQYLLFILFLAILSGLKELPYFAFSERWRFTAKLGMEIICLPLITHYLMVIPNLVMISTGNITEALPYYAATFGVVLVLSLYGAIYCGKVLKSEP